MSDQNATRIPINLDTTEFYSNPYPAYKWLRENAPVCWFDSWEGWLISQASDVATCFKDERFSANLLQEKKNLPIEARHQHESFLKGIEMWMFWKEGTEHARIRQATNKYFASKNLEANLLSNIETNVVRLLDTFAQRNSIDLISEFALPLPIQIIADILGFSISNYYQLLEWVDTLFDFFLMPFSPARIQKAHQAYESLIELCRQPLTEGRKNSLPTDLVLAEKEGILTEEEILSQCTLLIIAGVYSPIHLLGNSIIELLQHPEQFKLLKENLELMPSAVEELLRYCTPSLIETRWAKQDLEIRDQKIRAGDAVMLLVASANRDREYFTTPDHLDITRANNKHLAFGAIGGIHYCIGAHLTRLTVAIALQHLFQRFPQLKLAVPHKELKWMQTPYIRGVESLPVILN